MHIVSESTDVAVLVPTKPDAEIAAEIKKHLTVVLTEACQVMDEAKAAGLTVQFQLGFDFAGKNAIAQLVVAKHF